MVTFQHDTAGTSEAVWITALAERDLPALDLQALTGPAGSRPLRRLVVVAAHPDDETLGAAGLVAHAHAAGLEVQVVVATRGEASHPHSPSHTPQRLAQRRLAEVSSAVAVVAPGQHLDVLCLPDGRLAEHEAALTARVVALVGDGRDCLVVGPWRGDGHPDHEAAGRCAAAAAARTDARLLEYPVWFWHWGTPDDAPWGSALRLELGPAERELKERAVQAHHSQVAPLSGRPGDEVLLGDDVLAHHRRDCEVFWQIDAEDTALERLHVDEVDPWGVDERWYEQRKRELVLSCLPRQRFRRAVEVGCSTGALAAALAERCDDLLALDQSTTAVRRAQERLADAGLGHARAERASLPEEWPVVAGCDLVVISEVGYFLGAARLEQLLARVATSLDADGVVVLCHWRHEVEGWPLDGPSVHRAARSSRLLPPVAATYADRDVELLVLCGADQLPDPRPEPRDG